MLISCRVVLFIHNVDWLLPLCQKLFVLLRGIMLYVGNSVRRMVDLKLRCIESRN
ncbi:hypothetical protein ACS0TY_027282 [Phlomoides rotata]